MFMATAYIGDTGILDYLLVERRKRTSSGVKGICMPLVIYLEDLRDVGTTITRYERFIEELEERK